MATTLGGATLADPAAGELGHRISVVDVGGEMTMADGSLRVHHVGTRKRFELRLRCGTIQILSILKRWIRTPNMTYYFIGLSRRIYVEVPLEPHATSTHAKKSPILRRYSRIL